MIDYGRKDCEHVWRYRKYGWVEGCVPAICIECGAFGCVCDIHGPRPPKEIFFGEGQNRDADINGKWVNPYVEKKKLALAGNPAL